VRDKEIRQWQDLEFVSSTSSVGREALHQHTASKVASRQKSRCVAIVAHGRLEVVAELQTKVSSNINPAPREVLQRILAID
jgi:hypothetical protein